MVHITPLIIALAACFILSVALTPMVKKLAFAIGATDKPNARKVHQKIMPRLGGLAIYISFVIGYLIFMPNDSNTAPILIGATMITLIGALDDKFILSAKVKFIAQIAAATVTVLGGIQIDFVTLPFAGRIEFGAWAIPITILWIVGITNAINLIDGLDGLAAGVSAIALFTISMIAISMGNPLSAMMGVLLLGSTLGFLVFNFHPAKIFMGDTGALFLGYMIAVLSVSGLFKNVALFSLIVPIIILGVPILDTTFAIIRRIVQKKPLSAPDKLHLHHCLLNLGFSHRQTVIVIYAISGIFSITGVLYTEATMWGSTILIIALAILIELIVEITGLISDRYRPLLNMVGFPKVTEEERRKQHQQ
ncbi:MraY family glycosyltransferase [Terribacillus sp. 179-K 1B1 HS]|uniref:glycosyltransferase family 4 protein n=1 Tax=Terribacillus sp. 179-K 1B1 HS TaxID=3142388 RepID=UPI0039A26B40